MTASTTNVGFIGLGSMGKPMSASLMNAGYRLTLLDADEAMVQEYAARTGAQVAQNAADLARQCDIIITMLPTSAIVEAVLTGADGLLAGVRPDALILEMSSGVPGYTKNLAAQVEAAGAFLLDAPVSGGVSRAVTGELAIMVGGPTAQLERARPVLACMGKSVLHTGDVGSAHAMKALNNLVSAGGFLIGIEALMIGQRFGLDPAVMVDVLNSSTGMNNSTQKKFKQYVLSRAFNSGFGLDLMVKDLTIALDVAQSSGTPAPFSALCRELWAASASMLGSDQDHTAVAKLIEHLANTELSSAAVPPLNPDA